MGWTRFATESDQRIPQAGSWRARLTTTELPPDVLAVVMATGIVSVAAQVHHLSVISTAFAWLAVTLFATLGAGLLAGMAARPHSAIADVDDPDVAFRLFTAVAASAVLAARFGGTEPVVWLFGTLGLAAWLALVPPAIAAVRRRSRAELCKHARGAWLLPAVGSAGLAITAADLVGFTRSSALLDAGLAGWLLGIGTYLSVTWLIAARALPTPVEPGLITPDAWILMGALAISALAGDRLLSAAHAVHVTGWLPHAIRAVTLAAWILATLWIPLLVYAQIRSARHRRRSVRHAGAWWAAVFPLGMYSVATEATAVRFGVPQLRTVSMAVFWVAAIAWLLVATGWLRNTLAGRRRSAG